MGKSESITDHGGYEDHGGYMRIMAVILWIMAVI